MIMFLSVHVMVSLGRRLVPIIINNNLPPTWSSGISGDGKQVYYKSWPKGRIDSFVTAAESENVALATIAKGRIDILATVPRPHPLMRK